MSTAINPIGTPPDPNATTPAPTSPTDGLANESTFLQLLVAQLQNQDPESPQDGTQFVAQLAQFSDLEQTIQMRQDLDSIKGTLTPAPTMPVTTPPDPATTTTNQT